jgi:hypothetical protein
MSKQTAAWTIGDVPFPCVFRPKFFYECYQASRYRFDGLFIDERHRSWEELQNGWEWSPDLKTFYPCEKVVEV